MKASKAATKNNERKPVKSKPAQKVEYESSDEEDLSVDVLKSVFKNCELAAGSIESLTNAFNFGAVCLICISKVKRTEKIWSCTSCFCFFHLPCIQRWANDSLAQKRVVQARDEGYYTTSGEYVPPKRGEISWDCPKCRQSYATDEIPRDYLCFCRKAFDPIDQQWLIPHSCGELCMKKGSCSHSCLLLCHPGPCPPCPQILTTRCECQKSPPRAIRCAEVKWMCGKKCGKKLECGHACELTCHRECPPCSKKSKQTCRCGSKTKEQKCSDAEFACGKICNKLYPCGVHKCPRICCDDCGNCVYGEKKTCPCGKQKVSGICTEEVTSCGDTCGKLLPCGVHTCLQRCHQGECSECVELIEKPCRCGLFTKEVPCSKSYSCETKCKNLRSCKTHPCSRKCCLNDCPPCDKICGKTLSCGKHKCTSLCHQGYCYPCNEQSELKCRCGATMKTIPCGREKRSKPPKCYQPCTVKSKCRHAQKHSCHYEKCPPCQQKCDEGLACGHTCQAKCHDYVKIKTKDKNFKPSTPWEFAEEKIEFKQLEHPPCEHKVGVKCIGGHETSLWPCYNSRPSSCGRPCGRKLKCGNHGCELQCHTVSELGSVVQDANCRACNEDCIFPRPAGCTHPCRMPCHEKPCAPCYSPIKVPCFCGLIQVHFKCSDFYKDITSEELAAEQEKLLTCGNRCPKNYPCGHRCTAICHSGDCPNPEDCKKKTKVYCKCGQRKIDLSCDKVRNGATVSCDPSCDSKRKEAEESMKERERKQKEKEEEENRREIEMYEQKFAKKTYKERKRREVEVEETNFFRKFGPYIAGIILLFAVIAAYLFLM